MTPADIQIQLTAFLGATLVLAGIGKLSSRPLFSQQALAIVELVVGVLLGLTVSASRVSMWVRLICVLMFGSYFLYAATRPKDEKCLCFGDHLPTVAKPWYVGRNAIYLVSALATTVLPREPSVVWPTDVTVGVLAATLLVAAPPVLSWLRAFE